MRRKDEGLGFGGIGSFGDVGAVLGRGRRSSEPRRASRKLWICSLTIQPMLLTGASGQPSGWVTWLVSDRKSGGVNGGLMTYGPRHLSALLNEESLCGRWATFPTLLGELRPSIGCTESGSEELLIHQRNLSKGVLAAGARCLLLCRTYKTDESYAVTIHAGHMPTRADTVTHNLGIRRTPRHLTLNP